MTSIPFVRELPFSVDDSESDVLIRWSCTEVQQDGLVIARLFDNFVCRRLRLVDKIRIEYVELQCESVKWRGASGQRALTL